MLARFFQKSEPISFISLLFLLFIYVLIQVFSGYSDIIGFSFFLNFSGVFLFFSLLVFISDFIIQKNYLTPANYYAVFVFVLLIGLFPSVLSLSKISLSHLFVLLAVRRFYSIRTKKKLIFKLFDSGLYIGVAFLFYPLTLLYVLLIYISYFIYIRVINKDLLIPIIGFITPIFIVFTYFFINDEVTIFRTLTELNLSNTYINFKNKFFYIPLLSIILLVVWTVIKTISNRHTLDNDRKNSFNLVLLNFIIALFILVLDKINIGYNIQFLFLPTAILTGNLITFISRKWIKEIVLYGLLVLSFILIFFKIY
jgi:hypothetical protein